MVAKHDDGRSHLAETERLGVLREGVVGVGRTRLDLAEQLAVGEHLGGEDGLGPVGARGVEDGLVEDVVVAEVGVGAAQAGVVLQDVVAVEVVTERVESALRALVETEHKTSGRPFEGLALSSAVELPARSLGIAYRVKNVALGSGLAMIACSHIIAASETLKLMAVFKAWIALSFVMFLPS